MENKIRNHPSYIYARRVVGGEINAPKYVKIQCGDFLKTADGGNSKYYIDEKKAELIDALLKLMIMPRGLKAGGTVYDCTAGFQWLFYIAILCTMSREDTAKRRYETAILEICRKNGKTFVIAVMFILLLILEPKFAKLYSVAPDGALSREVKKSIREIIASSPALEDKFKIRRDDITCKLNENMFVPLNYSNSRLDGREPNVFLVDEVGALPNSYAIEAMQSGQTTVINRLGCIISTKYPTIQNPFEDEVAHAKKILDGIVEDPTVFALLYEPDKTEGWETDNGILEQANPLALEIPAIMEDILHKRERAIEIASARENFVTKHCNIIYQGVGTESYIDVRDLRKCSTEKIDWRGMTVYLGVDLSISNDNTSVVMAGYKDGIIYAQPMAFIPEGRIEEKSRAERVDYKRFIDNGQCMPCGNRIIDYGAVEEYVLGIEERYGVTIASIGFDRANAISSAQKWQKAGYEIADVEQHSRTLHPATKLLYERVMEGKFCYEENLLYEINFENAQCTYDTNLNRYVNKKRSNGKVDMTVATIIAVHMLMQYEMIDQELDWGIQIF